MRSRIFLMMAILLGMPRLAGAFLADADPQNRFAIWDQAPSVALVKLKQSQPPAGQNRYYIHILQVKSPLVGKPVKDQAVVLQDVFAPSDPGIFPKDTDAIVTLADLPNYTAYAAARQNGAEFRVFGGANGVLALNFSNNEAVTNLVKQWLGQRRAGGSAERKNLLFAAFDLPADALRNDAALYFPTLPVTRGFFQLEDFAKLEAAIPGLKPDAQRAVVRAIGADGAPAALDALKRIAGGPASPAKWAAVQQLEKAGIARSVADLKSDFSTASEQDKARVVAALAERKDEEARGFLTGILNGSESLNVKREVLEQMARQGGTVYETILIEQTGSRDEQVAMQATAALGVMPSEKAFDRIVALLDSPSPKIRGAAGMALMRSPDPRAVQIYHERFEERGFGHFH